MNKPIKFHISSKSKILKIGGKIDKKDLWKTRNNILNKLLN